MSAAVSPSRRLIGHVHPHAAAACACLALAAGCMGPIFRPQSPDAALSAAETPAEPPSQAKLVSAVAHPYGMNYVKVENVALVSGLDGTGEDPAPSNQRAALLAEMRRRGIENPNEVLASPNTALVLARAILRPGLQKGETFDVEVRVPTRSDTTSLRGGMLLETHLSEAAVLGGQIRYGHEAATAQGAILVDPSAVPDKDDAGATQGVVLGGGIAIKSRKIGLVLDHEHQSIRVSQTVAKAISDRFHMYVDGRRMGVATPKTDEFIELTVHPRYKENVSRYMRVIRSVAMNESPVERRERLELLRNQLLDPVTTEVAALRLEAIGDDAIEILKEGALATDPEVRFYSAESLAYLDVTEAVAPLILAVEEPAFRIAALAAMGSMKDGAAFEALYGLLGSQNIRTRYGAFRALSIMEPDDPRIAGQQLGHRPNGKFNYHVLPVEGKPTIHVTRSHRPEVVLFGPDHQLTLPLVLDAGPRILIQGMNSSTIRVARFTAGEPTQERMVPPNVDAVIRAIVDLEGEYPDIVQMLRQAKATGALVSDLREDALPHHDQQYDRDATPPAAEPEGPGELLTATE
jgi:hypothetical protein